MSFMYFGSLTTPFAELLPLFPPCAHIHLLIDSVISVKITASDEIWKLHHTCHCKKKRKNKSKREKKRERGGGKRSAITHKKILE